MIPISPALSLATGALKWIKNNWQLIAVTVVVGLVAWKVTAYVHEHGELREANARLLQENSAQATAIERQQAAMAATNAKLDDMAAKHAAAQARVDELQARPPEEIVRWRERIVTLPAEITGPTCVDALVQSAAVLRSEAGWPEDAP